MKGKFIVLEGIDCSGTTTQIPLIANYIYNSNNSKLVLITREPTYSKYGKRAREILKGAEYCKEEILDMFVKDRNWHIENIILPNLVRGVDVISDRYFLSTLVYQSLQGFNIEKIRKKQGDIIFPDITFLLDVNIDEAVKRLNSNRKSTEIFENRNFMEKCRERYLELSTAYPDIIIIDANKSIEEVTQQMIKHLA